MGAQGVLSRIFVARTLSIGIPKNVSPMSIKIKPD
jgi:hypothetical protein